MEALPLGDDMTDIRDHFLNEGEEITDDTRIYRVFSSERLSEMFHDKTLSLVVPAKWDDPFENFLAKCRVEYDTYRNVDISRLFRNFYGQCWTLNRETDAMWRIYSPHKDGARVSTTVGRLLRSIVVATDPYLSMSYYIGSVGYRTEGQLRATFENPENATAVAFDQTGRNQARILFLKREEFSHEREVRLLYRWWEHDTGEQRPEQVRQFPIEPNALFDDVLFDPRLDESTLPSKTLELRSLGFANYIGQSTLYKLPNLRIRLASAF